MPEVLFDKDDCLYIKSYWKDDNASNGKGYGKTSINNQLINVKRNVKGHYLDISCSDLLSFILEKVSKLGITSISSNVVKLTKYKVGDYFAPHKDYQQDSRGTIRKTLVIQLSNQNDYKGGELIVRGVKQSKTLGTYSIFNSNDIHEITEVKSGNRYSLVVFLFDKDLKIIDSVI